MKKRCHLRCPGRGTTAFSLIEVALALGLVGFALVGIVGSLPLAMNNGRLSIAQSRAATIAETIFANFRAQPFGAVQFLDTTAYTINLDITSTTVQVACFAYLDDVASTAPFGDARRLHFVAPKDDKILSTPTVPTTQAIPPSNLPSGAPAYQVILRFNNSPAGMLSPYTPAAGSAVRAQGNMVEVSINELDRPKDVFRFTSVIANRSE